MSKKLAFLLVFLLFLSGCAQIYQIEKLGVINTLGIDKKEENEDFHSSFIYFQFDPESKRINELVKASSETIYGTIQNANLEANYQLVIGKARMMVLGRSLAEEGASQVLDALNRNAKIPDTLFVTMADGQASEVLQSVYDNSTTNAGTYLEQIIDTNTRQEIVTRSTLRDFLHQYFTIGLDPVLPMVSINNGMPKIDKLALFRDDKYIGNINTREGFFVKLLTDNYKTGRVQTSVPSEIFKEYKKGVNGGHAKQLDLVLSEIRSKTKINVQSIEKVKFKIDVKIEGRIMETTDSIKINDEVMNKLEEEISKDLSKNLKELITKLQELKVDPIGFGHIYNTKRPITDEEWQAIYPNMEVDINIKTKILRHGMIQ
ncbi:Ger(x)C family spore germination protein [Sediminibacillus massiliensis]|uniref:Ger(x)C family spore germination protein n=1 Tax=Sediminibacillus massiliensis TaxID=1926277 RepID=UPI0009886328|nr:Ger(x)C family spore germination protein [Sediminibacillus massiliensis]